MGHTQFSLPAVYEMAKDLFKKELYSSAFDLIEIALPLESLERQNVYHHQFLLLKGECSYRLNQFDRALACYNEALLLLSPNSVYDVPIGMTQGGIDSLRNSNRNYLYSKISRCWLNLKEYERAANEINQIPFGQLDFGNKLLLFNINCVMDRMKAYQLGKDLLIESPCAMELIDEMLEMDEASLTDILHPNQPEWLKAYIRFKFHSVRLDLEMAQKEKTVLDCSIISSSKLCTEVGDAYYRQGEHAEAAVYFKMAFKKDEHSERLVGKYINTLHALNKAAELESVVTRKTCGLFPRNSQTYLGLSRIYEKNGFFSDAAIMCKKSFELNCLDLEVLITRGQLFYKQGQFRDSYNSFRVALSMQKNIHVYEGLVHAAIKLKLFKEAKLCAENCTRNMPKCYRAFVLLGKVHFFTKGIEGGDIGPAVQSFKSAVALAPTCSTPILWLALIERTRSNCLGAKKLIEEFIQKNYCAVSHAQLGFLNLLMKQFDEAHDCFNRALSFKSDLTLAKEGKKKLLDLKADPESAATPGTAFDYSFTGVMDPLYVSFF